MKHTCTLAELHIRQGIWNLKTLHFNNPSVYHYNLHDKQGSLITGYPWQVK
jgi:hypothetical protein